MRTEGQRDKWQQEEQVLCDSGKTFFHLHSVRFAHTGEPASDVGCGVQASCWWVGVGWGRFQNAGSNACQWDQKGIVLWRNQELMLTWRNKGWKRRTAEERVRVLRSAFVLASQSAHFSRGGQWSKCNVLFWLGSIAAKAFYCKCQFCYFEGFLL